MHGHCRVGKGAGRVSPLESPFVRLAHPGPLSASRLCWWARHTIGCLRGETVLVPCPPYKLQTELRSRELMMRYLVCLLVLACVPAIADAQSVENFYRGKTVNVVIG